MSTAVDRHEADLREQMRLEADRIREDAEHSMKGHWNCCRRWEAVSWILGCAMTAAAGLAGLSVIESSTWWAGAFTVTATILGAVNTALRPGHLAGASRSAGASYARLKDDARVFQLVWMAKSDIKDTELRALFQQLVERRSDLRGSSPSIARWAFEQARKGIKSGETEYSADAAREYKSLG